MKRVIFTSVGSALAHLKAAFPFSRSVRLRWWRQCWRRAGGQTPPSLGLFSRICGSETWFRQIRIKKTYTLIADGYLQIIEFLFYTEEIICNQPRNFLL